MRHNWEGEIKHKGETLYVKADYSVEWEGMYPTVTLDSFDVYSDSYKAVDSRAVETKVSEIIEEELLECA